MTRIGLGFADRDVAIRTVAGEASNQGARGMIAVAWVIRNRAEWSPAAWWGHTIVGVCTKRAQFSCWNGGANTDRIKSLATTDPEYRDAAEALDAVMGGEVPDPTGGATHYKVHGTPASWDEAVKGVAPVSIGDHDFWRLTPDGKAVPTVAPAAEPLEAETIPAGKPPAGAETGAGQ